jgi:hypothetical protein
MRRICHSLAHTIQMEATAEQIAPGAVVAAVGGFALSSLVIAT